MATWLEQVVMLGPVLCTLLTLAAFAYAIAMHPSRATCPTGWYTSQVRRDGVYRCARPYGCREYRGPRGGWTSECAGADEVSGVVYCTGGARAVTADGLTVGCQR
jgi:hypothetical protein